MRVHACHMLTTYLHTLTTYLHMYMHATCSHTHVHAEVVEFHKAGYEAEAVMSDESSLSGDVTGGGKSHSTNSSSSFNFPLSRQSSSLVTTPSDIILISSDSEGEEFECLDNG